MNSVRTINTMRNCCSTRIDLGCIALCAMLLLTGCQDSPQSQALVARDFTAVELPLRARVDLFDLGLVDINDDARLDVFTSNHTFAETALLNKESSFTWLPAEEMPSVTEGLPLFESTGATPEFKDGLNIFRIRRKWLAVFCRRCEAPLSGSLDLARPYDERNTVQLVYRHNAEVEIQEKYNGQPWFDVHVDFALQTDALIVLEVKYPDLAHRFRIQGPIQASDIHLDMAQSNPSGSAFDLVWRDNHAAAWAHINDDARMDVFLAVGGLRANLAKFRPADVKADQLFLGEAAGWRDVTAASGIIKGHCRTYSAAWVDFDGDGDLDLSTGCKNSENQLFMQQGVGSGEFSDVAERLGLNLTHGDMFRWLDWDRDGRVDLLAMSRNRLHWYRNTKDAFIDVQHTPILPGTWHNLAVADFDNDGWAELAIATDRAVHLIENGANTHRFIELDATETGLAGVAGGVQWVDVDQDGLLDLSVAGQGVFLQHKVKSFKADPLLSSWHQMNQAVFKHILWFDADANGQWDVLVGESSFQGRRESRNVLGYEFKETPVWDRLHWLANVAESRHWLQVDLHGSAYNRDAIGAVIEVSTGSRTQTRFVHGQHGSLHGQGHYRAYFGLGHFTEADVRVIWPDGGMQSFDSVASDQLLTLTKPGDEE